MNERGPGYLDEHISEREKRLTTIRTELEKRLTEQDYLTCEDFDHFDVTCCDTCHTFYPHYEMWIVVLSDCRHAWVCDSIEQILMRRTKIVPSSPDQEKAMKLLDEIFGGSDPDPVGDALHDAAVAASSDEDRLYYCLKYAHHVHKPKRGHEAVEALVSQALRLPGRGPAQRSRTAHVREADRSPISSER